MQLLEQQVLENLRTLPPLQQQQVLDFVEFLLAQSKKNTRLDQEIKPISALDLAGDLVGCVDGAPTDLSVNTAHMEGYGE